MKERMVPTVISLLIGFVLFAIVFVFGLMALISAFFGSLNLHGAETLNGSILAASFDLATHFAS